MNANAPGEEWGSAEARLMRQEITQEAMKATPPVVVAAVGHIAGMSLQDWVLVATLVYIGLQAAHLLWKWFRELKKGRK